MQKNSKSNSHNRITMLLNLKISVAIPEQKQRPENEADNNDGYLPDLCDPISLEPLTDSALLTRPNGHFYSQETLTQLRNSNKPLSPLSREPILWNQVADVTPPVRRIVESYKEYVVDELLPENTALRTTNEVLINQIKQHNQKIDALIAEEQLASKQRQALAKEAPPKKVGALAVFNYF